MKRRSKTLTVADDMILYIENPKDSTRKLLELINECSKVAGYKITHRNALHSCTLTMRRQKEKLRKHFHSPLQWKEKKYLGINLPKETKDVYIYIYIYIYMYIYIYIYIYVCMYKTINHWWKKSKMTQIDGEIYLVNGSEETI